MGFSRQEYWSGLPLSPPGIFLTQGLNLCLLHLQHCRGNLYHWATGEAPNYYLAVCHSHKRAHILTSLCFTFPIWEVRRIDGMSASPYLLYIRTSWGVLSGHVPHQLNWNIQWWDPGISIFKNWLGDFYMWPSFFFFFFNVTFHLDRSIISLWWEKKVRSLIIIIKNNKKAIQQCNKQQCTISSPAPCPVDG